MHDKIEEQRFIKEWESPTSSSKWPCIILRDGCLWLSLAHGGPTSVATRPRNEPLPSSLWSCPSLKRNGSSRVNISSWCGRAGAKESQYEWSNWLARTGQKEREFSYGDQVFLKLKPYKKGRVALRKNFKLNPGYYRPYQISRKKIGGVANLLKLPERSCGVL
jgi:hypothetical protein